MRHVVRALAAAVLLALSWSAAASSAEPTPSSEQRFPVSSERLYEAMLGRAAAGSTEAARMVEAVDAYLAERGLTLDDMPAPVESAERITDGMAVYRLEGVPPWSLRVTNDTEVDDAETLDAYREVRHEALRALADATPAREIVVAVTPDGLISIDDFMAALACDCRVLSLDSDIWLEGDWVMRSGLLEETDIGQLEGAILEGVRAALDLYEGIAVDDVEATVHRVELSLPASEAAALASRGGVLIADPLSDVEDRFADRAAVVEVVNTPDVFGPYAGYALGLELVPGAIVPVLQDEQ